MNAHEFINYKLEFDLNHPYIPTEEEIISVLDERDDVANNEPIKEADNVQIGDVMVDGVAFKDAKSALVTLKKKLERRPTDVISLVQSICTLQKEIRTLACTNSSKYFKFNLPLRLDVR